MGAYVFDLETDGLLDEVTKVHCLVIHDVETGSSQMFNNQGNGRPDVELGLRILRDYAEAGFKLIAHNGIEYDIPVLTKLYPWFSVPQHTIIDTLVYVRSLWPDLKDKDHVLVKKDALPKQLQKRHSLEAWGHRLAYVLKDPTLLKGDYKGGWATWNQEMEDYCQQDGRVTAELYKFCVKNHQSDLSLWLEHQVAWILARQQRYGFLFSEERAAKLYATLVGRRTALEDELRGFYQPFLSYDGEFTPKRDDKRRGYVAGVRFTKLRQVEFNPSSRDHIVNRLMTLHGWVPSEFTNDGKPKMDEAVMEGLNLPNIERLKEYFLIQKRIGQVAEGKEAWLKKVGKDGRMHGRVNPNGAVTGRMTHSGPNMAQVPAKKAPYGKECRACFIVPEGKVLVGADAAALELRDLAGYMALYDGGSYVDEALRGDVHSVNCRALGMDPKTHRDVAKTFFYAFIYGAGDEKLGLILSGRKGEEARAEGRQSRAAFLKNLPALGKLVSKVKARAKERGFLVGLDGRHLSVRSQHAALNTLLQSAGAVQMKMALVLLDQQLQADGLIPGTHYEFVANVHDEWQLEVDIDKGEHVGTRAVEAIRLAGERLDFRCPLSGEWKSGKDWAATH